MDPIFLGRTLNGTLKLDQPDRARFEAFLRSLHGEEIEISVRRRRHARSTDANAFYWGVVVKALAKETGHTSEEIHEILKEKFLMDRSATEPRVRSTTELDKHEFAEYVERCIQLAAENGVSLPAQDRVAS